MTIHAVTITDREGNDYLFASPDGETYLELRDLTGVTPDGLRDVMDNGRRDPESGRMFLPMQYHRNFFRQCKRSDTFTTVTYTDPEPIMLTGVAAERAEEILDRRTPGWDRDA